MEQNNKIPAGQLSKRITPVLNTSTTRYNNNVTLNRNVCTSTDVIRKSIFRNNGLHFEPTKPKTQTLDQTKTGLNPTAVKLIVVDQEVVDKTLKIKVYVTMCTCVHLQSLNACARSKCRGNRRVEIVF